MKRVTDALPGLLAVVTIVTAVLLVNSVVDHYLAGDFTKTIKFESGSSENDKLPAYWRPSSGSEDERRTYNFKFETSGLDLDDLAIYFPIFQPHIAIYLNDTELVGPRTAERRSGTFSADTLLVQLPADLLIKGSNRLVVEIRASKPGFAYLYPFRVGPYDSLLGVAKAHSFVLNRLPMILVGALLILFLFSLFSSLSVKDRPPFLWVFSGALILATHTLLLTLDREGVTHNSSFVSFGLVPLTAASIYQYASGVVQKRTSGVVTIIIVLYVACWLLFVAIGGDNYIRFLFAITGPLFYIFTLVTFGRVLLRFVNSSERWSDLFLLGALALMFFAGLHDGLARSGLNTDWVTLRGSVYGSLLVTVVASHILWQRVRSADVEFELRERIQIELLKRERELESSFDRRQDAAKVLAQEEERSRILRELHDGVASQLVMISTLAQSPSAERTTLRSIAQSALTDLRAVVSTLAIKNTDLKYVLALFREQYLKPLESSGVKINWNLFNAVNVYGFSSSQSLNLLRILQEAATNSVKHAVVTKISVSVEPMVDSEGAVNQVVVHCEDEGELSFEPNKMGLGIRNMVERADQLNAAVDFVPTSQGLRIEIILNVTEDNDNGALRLTQKQGRYGDI